MNCKQWIRSVIVVLFTCILIITGTADRVSAAQPPTQNLNIVSVDSRPLYSDKFVYTALKEINYQASITTTVSLQSAYELADNHNRDGVISSLPNATELFTHLRRVPAAIEDINVYVFARSDKNIEINSWEALSGFRVGMLPQRVYLLSKVPSDTKVVQKENTRILFEGLANGEYDVVILTVAEHEAFNLPKATVRVGHLETLKEYFYLHESLEYLIPDITAAFKKLEEDGRKEKILSSVPMPKMYPGQTILHINSYNAEISREDQFNKALKKHFPNSMPVEWYSISLNSRRFLGDSSRLTYFSGILRRDFVSRDVAAIIVSGEEALEFLRDYYALFFKDVPVLFYGITDIYKKYIPPGYERFFSGVVENLPAHETISAAQELFPDAKNLFVINDYTPEGRAYNKVFENQLSPLAGVLNIKYNENTDRKTLVERIKGLPKDSIVLIGSYFCDSNGQYYAQDEMKRTLESDCPAPVFALYSATLAYGPLGGKFLDYQKYAELIAGMLKQLLNGEDIANIPIMEDTTKYNRWIFDENMMKKWNISERSLPIGTEIINKAPTVWEANPALMVGIVVFSLASLIIITLLMLFTKKLHEKNAQLQRAEALLERDNKIREIKERLECIISTAPISYVLDIGGTIVEINEALRSGTGMKIGDNTADFCAEPAHLAKVLERLNHEKTVRNEVMKIKMANGEIHRAFVNVTTVEYNGQPASVSWGIDIEETERQKDELREIKERTERILQTAPVMYALLIDGIAINVNEVQRYHTGLDIDGDIRTIYANLSERDALVGRILAEGKVLNEVHSFKFTDGSIHRCLVSAVSVEHKRSRAIAIWSIDIEENEKQKDKLKAAHRSLKTVLDAMPVPVRIIDLETEHIAYMNKSCMELLEFDSGSNISNLFARDILPEYNSDGTLSYKKIEAVKATEEAFSIDIEYLTAKGNIIDSRLTACHIEYKGIKSSVGIIRDLSQERREAELRSTAIAAENASHAKTMFLANMSHEIRTPMNGIIGMTDLLMGESLSERQSQYVKDIKISAESLLGIINDILDLSKINEGMLHIMPVDIDLSAMLKNTVSMLSFAAHSKNLNFIDDIQINMPEYVCVDDVRLNQILVNLLSNAVKFTKKGHVKLLVKIEDGNIVFEVSDTGVGILPDDLPLIFMPFEQADKRKNRAIKGTGLGLSVTKNLVELMGGKIWAESEYGTGTVFHVTIPYVPGDESAVEVIDKEFRYIFAPTAQILLVDDIQTNLTVGAGLLRMCGITADVAMSGSEAIELVKAKDYDLVFMDHMMPEMDGIEAMKLIRAIGGKYCELPIIALTANAVNESKELLLNSGMNDFLSKPIDKVLLMNILQKWLPADKIETDTKPTFPEQDTAYSEILAAASKIDGLDIELALSRISGMQDVLETSLKQTAFAIEGQLRRMDDFLSHGNLHGFAIEAHGLKGTFSNIGAMRHSELAAGLEIASKAENMPLCAKNFTVFADIMQGFANELKLLFPPSETESRLQGGKDFLELKISEAIKYLDSFEDGDALGCLNELALFTFGAETDKKITEATTAAEAFNYEKAVSLLKNI